MTWPEQRNANLWVHNCVQAKALHCPYCGESIELIVDPSGGEQSYVEDCSVCCRPIEITLEIGATDADFLIRAHRDDD